VKAPKMGIGAGVAILAIVLLIPAVGLRASMSLREAPGDRESAIQERPAAATAENIKMGQELFASAGCAVCHGADAKGKKGMTEDLTAGQWKHAEGGTFEAIAKTITSGLTREETGGMLPMPTAAAKKLTDEQVTALAAYVWSLSHSGS